MSMCLLIFIIMFISADNENRAHCPDCYNPDWYVQTEEVKLEIPNKEVKVVIKCIYECFTSCMH